MTLKFQITPGLILVLAIFCTQNTSTCANPMRAPDERDVLEARSIVDSMKKNPRGPYKQIRWFCNDGSVLPPAPYACRDHGGGRQYAEYSNERIRLAELGWSAGTIIAALTWEKFWDSQRNHFRMREIPLEKYLVDIDNGWVLEKAKNYRGRVQIESEEENGRQLLLLLAEQPGWLADNFLLMRELVRTIPHGGGGDISRDIRRIAQNIAEQESGFENLRIEIHTSPSFNTINRIKVWIKKFRPGPEQESLTIQVNDLKEKLELLYGESGRHQRMEQVRIVVGRDPALNNMQELLSFAENESELDKLTRLGRLLAAIRDAMLLKISAVKRLQLLDGIGDIEAELRLTADTLLQEKPSLRSRLLVLARGLVQSTYGGGFLSLNERDVLLQYLDASLEQDELEFNDYQTTINGLNLAGTWALGAVRYTFAEPLMRYTALEPRAGTFVDDMLRSSPLLQLAQVARKLAFDAENISSVQKILFDQPASALMALNPGIAIGPLYIATEQEIQNGLKPGRENIVVLPQTVSELPPVSGVMTVGESNMLSHVQLLARNFGIPNVALSRELFDRLKPYQGMRVVLAAAGNGSVIVSTIEQLSPEQKHILARRDSEAQG